MAIIKCPECKKDISDQAVTCPNCGYPIKSANNVQETNNLSASNSMNEGARYTNSISAPRGKKKKSVGFKIALSFLLLFIFGIAVGIVQMVKNPDLYQNNIYKKSLNITLDEAKKVEAVFKSCDIKEVTKIEMDKLLDLSEVKGEKGYRVSADGTDSLILYMNKDNSVYSIKYANNDLYLNKKVIASIKDYTFTIEEQTNLKAKCEDAVNQILKAPSTAEFPNILKWAFGKEDGMIIVQSYVDSENSFGAAVRSEFQFTFSKDDYKILSFIFDGEEYINN